jgi:hypothetical protein
MSELSFNEPSIAAPGADPGQCNAAAHEARGALTFGIASAAERGPQIDRLRGAIDLAADTFQPEGPIHLEQDQAWWRQEAARTGTDWPALVVQRLLELESLCVDLLERIEALEGQRSPFAEMVEAAPQRQAAAEPKRRTRPTPGTVVEAIMYCVRARGPEAFDEPKNQERLRRCDNAALAQIDRRMAKLGVTK